MKTGAILLLTLLAVLLFGAPQKTATPKDAKLLRLSLEVMLYNKDLEHALSIAREGMKRFPGDSYWIRQSAQIALWSGKMELAQKLYLALYQKFHDLKDKAEAERLATATGDTRQLVALYETALKKKFDTQTVKKLFTLYNDTGYLERGRAFFTELARKHRHPLPAKAALLLAFDYLPFTKTTRLYRRFEKQYGYDPELLYRYARTLFSRKRYEEAFTAIDKYASQLTEKEKELYNLYLNLTYITQHEEKLYTILAGMHRYHILPKAKENLFFQMLQKKYPQQALSYAEKHFLETPTQERFFQLAYLAVDTGAFRKLEKLFKTLPRKLRTILQKNYRYWILKARTLQALHRPKAAQIAFMNARERAPLLPTLHESYLWFLIDTANRPALRKELLFLAKHPALQKQIPYPVALGYFSLENGKDAKKFVQKRLAEKPDDWQIQLFYADILTLWSDDATAARHLRKAWLLARQAERTKHFCQNDKSKCYDYIRLGIRFDPRHARSYLEKGRKILSPQALADLKISRYTQLDATRKIAMLLHRFKQPNPQTQLSMALQQNDRETASQLLQHHADELPQMDKISALQTTGAIKAYESALFAAMQNNPYNTALADAFAEHIQNRGAKVTAELSHSDRSDLKADTAAIAYNHPLPRGFHLALSGKTQHFHTKTEKQQRNETSLSLYRALKQSTFRFEAGIGEDTKHYAFLKATLGYRTKHLALQGRFTLHERDDTTAYTQLYGFRDSATVQIDYRFNRYENLTLDMQANRYTPTPCRCKSYGQNAHLQYTRYLRHSYPDIYGQLFAEVDIFQDKSSKLPRHFWQTGISAGIGTAAKAQFHRTPKPYATATLLYNSRTHLGYSATVGTGKRLLRRDYIGVEMTYANGTGKYEEDYFWVGVRYVYW